MFLQHLYTLAPALRTWAGIPFGALLICSVLVSRGIDLSSDGGLFYAKAKVGKRQQLLRWVRAQPMMIHQEKQVPIGP
jgi:hypothetical protein